MHLTPEEVLKFVFEAVPRIVSLVGGPPVRIGLTPDANAYASRKNGIILVNPQWLSDLASPFGGFMWSRAQHRAFIVGLLAHEVGHILGARGGHVGEYQADGVAAFVLSRLRLDPHPFMLWLFSTHSGPNYPGGFERMGAAQNRWAQMTYFPAS